MQSFNERAAFQKLTEFAKNAPDLSREGAITEKRVHDYTLQACHLKMLYATERVDDSILQALCDFAKESECLKEMRMIQDMEIMNHVNNVPKCEDRAVGHHAIRMRSVDRDHPEAVRQAYEDYQVELEKLEKFLPSLRDFKNMIVIGIGGSSLGPQAVSAALQPFNTSGRKVFFSSNMDPDKLKECMDAVDLNETVFAVVSKSGGTLEIKYQEQLLRKWLQEENLNPKDRIIMVTGKESPMDTPANYREIFYMWDFVGGRYSVCSMVGAVPLAFEYGMDMWRQFLSGMADMDVHAKEETDPMKNLPLLGALIGIWNRNFIGCNQYAVLPYIQSMELWSAHLQQLFMESNCKKVSKRTGKFIEWHSCPVVFGRTGTASQHSYFQGLHQGTQDVAMEFIGFKHSQYGADAVFDGTSNHDKLLSNLFAQSLSLATGKHSDNLNQFFPGNRPNHMIIGANLDAYTLGNLLAYQECYVEFQGIMWDVNSFDQEGVQLGKVVANNIIDLYKEQRAGKTSGASDVAMAYIKEMDAIDKGGCSFNSGENTG